MEVIFVPALQEDAGGSKGLLPGGGGSYKDTGWDCPNWFDPRLKGAASYYPHALISYYRWRKLKHRPFPEDGHIIGDSGGFSVMTIGAAIDPRSVLRWQMRHCNVGIVLDVPPVATDGHHIFETALEATVRNVKAARPLYREHLQRGSAFRWWGAVHGWTTQDLERWWQTIRDVYPFEDAGEGWAFKPRDYIHAATTARVLGFIRKHKEIKRAHFLMTTGIDTVTVLFCLGSEAGLEFVSCDSTSFTIMATNRVLLTADGLRWHKQRERGHERHLRDFMLNTCPCPSCEMLRHDTQRYPDLLPTTIAWTGYWVFRFAYHNLLCTLQVFENLRRAAASDPAWTLTEVLGRKEAARVRCAFEWQSVFPDTRGTPRTLLDMI